MESEKKNAGEGRRKERIQLDAGGTLGPEKQEIRGEGAGNGSWDSRGNGDTERVSGSEPAWGGEEKESGEGEGGRPRGREGDEDFLSSSSWREGPGCDRGNDGKSHWSCWSERICLRNKLFISQL